MTDLTGWRFPAPLVPGNHARVVAPSGPFDLDRFARGIDHLRGDLGLVVDFDPTIYDCHGFLAGSDERRRRELQSAIDGEADLIIAARGGTGLGRILPALSLASLRRRPRWIAGFSDVTALHAELWRARIASIHGPNVTGLGDDEDQRRAFQAAVTARARRRWHLEGWRPGRAAGPLVGGNLTMLHAAAAAGRLTFPPGAVLLIEDVGEVTYRLDRSLTNLIEAGCLDPIAGVIVGTFTNCSESRGVAALAAIKERLLRLRVPVVAGAPVGHGAANEAVILGATARIDGNVVVLDGD